jgi:hypothetical protein
MSNERSVEEKVEDLLKSVGAVGFAGAICGATLGAYEPFARGRPFLQISGRVALNAGIFSSLTYVARESIRNGRMKIFNSSKDSTHSVGVDGALAGALTGFLACRLLGRHGRYAYVGAAWCALIAGAADCLLSREWLEMDEAEIHSTPTNVRNFQDTELSPI